jgi:hypothetical protein
MVYTETFGCKPARACLRARDTRLLKVYLWSSAGTCIFYAGLHGSTCKTCWAMQARLRCLQNSLQVRHQGRQRPAPWQPKSVASSAGAMGANEAVPPPTTVSMAADEVAPPLATGAVAAPNARATLDPLTSLTRC